MRHRSGPSRIPSLVVVSHDDLAGGNIEVLCGRPGDACARVRRVRLAIDQDDLVVRRTASR